MTSHPKRKENTMSLHHLRRLAAPLAVLALTAAALTACSSSDVTASDGTASSSEPLKLWVAATPHHEILDFISENLIQPEDNLTLELTDEQEGVAGNQLILDGEVDGSFTQHLPYLKQWLADAGADADAIVPVATVHVEPLGLYYNQDGEVTSLDDVGQGTSIAITSDVVNQNRALLLLADNGLIELPDGFDKDEDSISVKDVLDDDALNPLGLDLVEVDYALTARSVVDGETDLAVVNGNVALQTGLSAEDDTLVLETAEDNPYANLLTVAKDLQDDPRVLKLAEYLESPEVSDWITETYGTSVLPVQPGTNG